MQALVAFCRSVESELGQLQEQEWSGKFTTTVEIKDGTPVAGACESDRCLVLQRESPPSFRGVFDSLNTEFTQIAKQNRNYFGKLELIIQLNGGIVVDIHFKRRQTFSLRT